MPKLGLFKKGLMPHKNSLDVVNDIAEVVEPFSEFPSHYKLEGKDIPALQRVFSQEVTGFLAANPGWSIEVQHGDILAYRMNEKCPPDQYMGFVEEVRNIVNKLNK